MSKRLNRHGRVAIAITIIVAMLALCIYCKKAQEPEAIYQPKSFPGAAAPRRGGLRD